MMISKISLHLYLYILSSCLLGDQEEAGERGGDLCGVRGEAEQVGSRLGGAQRAQPARAAGGDDASEAVRADQAQISADPVAPGAPSGFKRHLYCMNAFHIQRRV